MSTNAHFLFEEDTDTQSQPPAESHLWTTAPQDYVVKDADLLLQSDTRPDDKNSIELSEDTDGKFRQKVQEKAAWWASILTALKLGFLVALFNFFRTSGLKQVFQTTALHYAMLPIAVAFECVEVITDSIQIIAAKKSTPKHWISLGVNLLRLAGVGLAVGLILSGIAVAGSVFATLAGAAFVFAVGVKTLWHAGSAIYCGIKSLTVKNEEEKSNLRHEAINHTIGAGIAAALAVCIGFVMLKGSLLFAAVGMGVSGAGAIAGLGIMAKDYYRKQKAQQHLVSEAKDEIDNDPLLSKNYPRDPLAPQVKHDPRYQSSYETSEQPTKSDWRCCNPFAPLGKLLNRLSIFPNSYVSAEDAKRKRDDDYRPENDSPEIASSRRGPTPTNNG